MLRIHETALELIAANVDTLECIARKDPDLARQLRKCLSSIANNISEGSGSQGRNRIARYYVALGSAREAHTCLLTAAAFRYTPPMPASVEDKLQKIIGTLRVVTR